jgi:signal recognition particle subunit SRP54
MGDILSLVEQAQRKFDQEEMVKQQERLRKGEFTLDDFRKMLDQTQRLGPLDKVMGMIPGMGDVSKLMGDADAAAEMSRLRGIVDSMTAEERRNPNKVIDQSRRRRIAAGAGVEPHEVNKLVKEFEGMADLMKRMSGMGMRGRLQAAQQLSQTLMKNPSAMLAKQKKGTGKRLTPAERAKAKKMREREARRRKRDEKKNRGQ